MQGRGVSFLNRPWPLTDGPTPIVELSLKLRSRTTVIAVYIQGNTLYGAMQLGDQPTLHTDQVTTEF